jgi:hypothetical protein
MWTATVRLCENKANFPPCANYAAEDFIAVDGLQGREFRVRYNARYDSSSLFGG